MLAKVGTGRTFWRWTSWNISETLPMLQAPGIHPMGWPRPTSRSEGLWEGAQRDTLGQHRLASLFYEQTRGEDPHRELLGVKRGCRAASEVPTAGGQRQGVASIWVWQWWPEHCVDGTA